MKVIYLASGNAILKYDNVVYNDLIIKRDLYCDMMCVDLDSFDFLIATPPCNYWSRANYRRNSSIYSLNTKHLLLDIIKKFNYTGKLFIVENVLNDSLFEEYGIYDYCRKNSIFIIKHGRHTYFTNILFVDNFILSVPQKADNIAYTNSKIRQGGINVNAVFDSVIDFVLANYFN